MPDVRLAATGMDSCPASDEDTEDELESARRTSNAARSHLLPSTSRQLVRIDPSLIHNALPFWIQYLKSHILACFYRSERVIIPVSGQAWRGAVLMMRIQLVVVVTSSLGLNTDAQLRDK